MSNVIVSTTLSETRGRAVDKVVMVLIAGACAHVVGWRSGCVGVMGGVEEGARVSVGRRYS